MKMTEITKLFSQLSTSELALSQELAEIIVDEIKQSAGQVLPFNRYMELALYYPQLGYYSNPLFKFGAKGDFVTAPLISNLFGYMLARQLNELFSFGIKQNILEVGAGNGKLAVDILSSLGDSVQNYFILELSADLIAWQQETIASKVPHLKDKVIWLNELPRDFNGVILANEVLDAQPCELVSYHDGVAGGLGVTYQDGKFSFKPCQLSQSATHTVGQLALDYHDYITEIHTANQGFVKALAESLVHGAVLLIDYGVSQAEYYHPQKARGSLRGFFRQHVLDDILVYPGLIDITSSVNWTSIVTTAIENDLEFIGYTNQGSFLINCGITNVMHELKAQLPEAQYLQLSNQVNKLISHNEMGESFKVCGFSKGIDEDSWLGFSDFDRSYSL